MTMADVVARAIEKHARETAPDECCGLLLGVGDEVIDAVRMRNCAADPQRRYAIDPAEHFAVMRMARGRDVDVIGAYHSHPASPPVPSETDRQEAFENFHFMIVGKGGEIRAWRLERGNFIAVPIVRT